MNKLPRAALPVIGAFSLVAIPSCGLFLELEVCNTISNVCKVASDGEQVAFDAPAVLSVQWRLSGESSFRRDGHRATLWTFGTVTYQETTTAMMADGSGTLETTVELNSEVYSATIDVAVRDPSTTPPTRLTLAVANNVGGTIVMDGTDACSPQACAPVDLTGRNTDVVLRAVPDVGYLFKQWDGACGTGTSLETTIEHTLFASDMFCTATFKPDTVEHPTLELDVIAPMGVSGRVEVNGPGVSQFCDSADCSYEFRIGDEVTLTASSTNFARWVGACGDTQANVATLNFESGGLSQCEAHYEVGMGPDCNGPEIQAGLQLTQSTFDNLVDPRAYPVLAPNQHIHIRAMLPGQTEELPARWAYHPRNAPMDTIRVEQPVLKFQSTHDFEMNNDPDEDEQRGLPWQTLYELTVQVTLPGCSFDDRVATELSTVTIGTD